MDEYQEIKQSIRQKSVLSLDLLSLYWENNMRDVKNFKRILYEA